MSLREELYQHKKLCSADYHHTSRELHDLWQAQRNLCSHIERLNKNELKLQQQIEKLQRQVNCGVQEHQFKLNSVYNSIVEDVLVPFGLFICSNCKIQLHRKLTQKEIESAKKLGFIS